MTALVEPLPLCLTPSSSNGGDKKRGTRMTRAFRIVSNDKFQYFRLYCLTSDKFHALSCFVDIRYYFQSLPFSRCVIENPTRHIRNFLPCLTNFQFHPWISVEDAKYGGQIPEFVTKRRELALDCFQTVLRVWFGSSLETLKIKQMYLHLEYHGG